MKTTRGKALKRTPTRAYALPMILLLWVSYFKLQSISTPKSVTFCATLIRQPSKVYCIWLLVKPRWRTKHFGVFIVGCQLAHHCWRQSKVDCNEAALAEVLTVLNNFKTFAIGCRSESPPRRWRIRQFSDDCGLKNSMHSASVGSPWCRRVRSANSDCAHGWRAAPPRISCWLLRPVPLFPRPLGWLEPPVER